MPRAKKSKEPQIWPEEINLRNFSFISVTEPLIDLGLWEETNCQVHHRFGSTRFISYSRPIVGKQFRLVGKLWKIKQHTIFPVDNRQTDE